MIRILYALQVSELQNLVGKYAIINVNGNANVKVKISV